MATAVEIIGFLILMLMGSALDSESIIPIFGTLTGLGIMLAGMLLERRYNT